MATLLELHTVEQDSTREPAEGEPEEVTLARELRAKIRTAALKAAHAILVDTIELPTTDPQRTAALERIAWARQTVQSPDTATQILLRLSLSGNAAQSQDQILRMADAAIEARIGPLIGRLGKGLQLGR